MGLLNGSLQFPREGPKAHSLAGLHPSHHGQEAPWPPHISSEVWLLESDWTVLDFVLNLLAVFVQDYNNYDFCWASKFSQADTSHCGARRGLGF